MKKLSLVLLILVVAVLGAAGWYTGIKFEEDKPTVTLDPKPPQAVGREWKTSILLQDKGQGLKSFKAIISQGRKTEVLAEQTWPPLFFSGGSGVGQARIDLELTPEKLGLSDGPAVLSLEVRDYAWRESFHGNKAELTKEIVIDTKPARLTVLSGMNYLNMGGSGLVVFEADEEVRAGVAGKDCFFPAVPDPDRKNRYICLFASPVRYGTKPDLVIRAVDVGGNQSEAKFRYRVRRRPIRRAKINITDGFLKAKLPEFRKHYQLPEEELSAFLAVNRTVRRQNFLKIKEIASRPSLERLWSGRFLRLPKSKRTAGFADQRTYFHDGREIDRQTHMGFDLASVERADTPAAARGRVVFNDYLGIYGNMVILDHGQGLYSLYAHLTDIAVKYNDLVERGQTIARTGASGMAGGDHLHWSILVSGEFVNPMEWLDGHWIHDNIDLKLKDAQEAD